MPELEIKSINGIKLKDEKARELIEELDDKFENINNGTQANTIEKIKVNDAELPISDKAVNISVPTDINELNGVEKLAFKTDIINVYKYKGSVPDINHLPTHDLTIGDVYNLEDNGKNVAWTGNEWDDLGGIFECSIENILVNGVLLPINNKTVNIKVPIKTSELQNDSAYVTVNKYVNVQVLTTDFVEDDTFEDYPYKADIIIEGVKEDDCVHLVFSFTDVKSMKYAPVCDVNENTITIYATEIPTDNLTIPLIEVIK